MKKIIINFPFFNANLGYVFCKKSIIHFNIVEIPLK